jgi:hypothetical protein
MLDTNCQKQNLFLNVYLVKEENDMAKCVDGFILVVPDSKVAEYTKNQKSIETR